MSIRRWRLRTCRAWFCREKSCAGLHQANFVHVENRTLLVVVCFEWVRWCSAKDMTIGVTWLASILISIVNLWLFHDPAFVWPQKRWSLDIDMSGASGCKKWWGGCGKCFPTQRVDVSRWISKESTSSSRFGTLQDKKLLDPLRYLAVDMFHGCCWKVSMWLGLMRIWRSSSPAFMATASEKDPMTDSWVDSHSQKTIPPIPEASILPRRHRLLGRIKWERGSGNSLLLNAFGIPSKTQFECYPGHLYSDIWSTQTSVPHCYTPEVPCWCMISPVGHPLIAWRSGSWMRGKMRSRPLVQGAGSGCHTCLVVSKYHGHLWNGVRYCVILNDRWTWWIHNTFYHMQVRERYEQIMRHSCVLTFKEYGDHAHWQQVRLGTPRGELWGRRLVRQTASRAATRKGCAWVVSLQYAEILLSQRLEH